MKKFSLFRRSYNMLFHLLVRDMERELEVCVEREVEEAT